MVIELMAVDTFLKCCIEKKAALSAMEGNLVELMKLYNMLKAQYTIKELFWVIKNQQRS